MKKFLSVLLFTASMAVVTMAQNIPQGMKYQAVARTLKGDIMANEKITLKINLTGGKSSALYYTETHSVVTNELGLFAITIGEGKGSNNSFNNIPWASEDIWMEVAILGKDNGYTTITNSKLLAVPYAFHAGTANQLAGSESPARSNTKLSGAGGVPSQSWSLFGNVNTDPTKDRLGTTDNTDLVLMTNNVERFKISADGNIAIQNNLAIDNDLQVKNDLTVNKNAFLNVSGGNTVNNGSFTVTNAKPTQLSGTLGVTGSTALNDNLTVGKNSSLKGELGVDGVTNLNEALHVNNGKPTALTGKLDVDGVTNLNEEFNVNNAKASTLSGELAVGGITNLNNGLNVNNVKPTVLSGELSVNQRSFFNGQVTVQPRIPSGDDETMYDYPLIVTGGAQGIAVQVNEINPAQSNNFITFFNSKGDAKGRVEGQNGLLGIGRDIINAVLTIPALNDAFNSDTSPTQDLKQPPTDLLKFMTSNYALGALNLSMDFVADVIRLVTNIIGAGGTLCTLGDCDDVIWSAVDVIEGDFQLAGYIIANEASMGVAFESGGADYAEWLQKADTEEQFTFGDVVGVKGGMISKKFGDAEKFMIVSRAPVIIGGMPNDNEEIRYEKIAFMGQVPVKVIGKAHRGDYIIPTGKNDGMAIALAPAKMLANDYKRIIGIAWADADTTRPFNYINTAVGINANDMAGEIEQMQLVMNNMQQALTALVPNFKPSYYAVGNHVANNSGNNITVAQTLNEKARSDIGGMSKYHDLTEAMTAVGSYAKSQGTDLSQYPMLNDLFNHPTVDNAQKTFAYYTKAMERARELQLMAQQSKKGTVAVN